MAVGANRVGPPAALENRSPGDVHRRSHLPGTRSVTAVTGFLPDVQAQRDYRGVALDEVGVTGFRTRLGVRRQDGALQQTVAKAELCVALGALERGTHMSRFVAALD